MVDITVDAVKGIAQLLAVQVWDELNLAWGFQDQLEKLKAKIIHTQAFLNDVGNTKHPQKLEYIESWLQKYKDVAYDASEVMDDYEYEILRRKVELGNTRRKKLRSVFRCNVSNPIVFRFRMAHKVEEVLSKFDELGKEAIEIGLQMKLAKEVTSSFLHDDADSYSRLQDIRKHAYASSSEFVGRETDIKILLDEILYNPEKQNQPSIIAIVGLGGLGKTTLARCLYKHEKVVANFGNRKAWVCVSEDFNVERLCKEIHESFSKNDCNMEELKMKKNLIVLDDVWNDDHELWDTLQKKLVEELGSVTGSAILISTRSDYVATAAVATFTHKLKGLTDDESWELFKQIASNSKGGSNLHCSFENVGKRIIEKCKGVPLAIKTIGALLVKKKKLSDWKLIEGSRTWNLEQSGYVQPSLLLSYNHLPSLSVKQCFAYCAIFPKDCAFEKDNLIALWGSQDFIHDDEILSMEENGERIFNILLNNSFLQEEESKYFKGGITFYKMHDLVHDLAYHILQKDLFIWDGQTPQPNMNFKFRHLVCNFKEEEKTHKVDETVNIHKVSTINVCRGSKLSMWDISTYARYLRTLIIAYFGTIEVPTRIEQLKHLRYLDMSVNEIPILPDSICSLYQLQTLIITCKHLPRELYKLINLRVIKVFCLDCRWLPIVEKLPNLTILECRQNFVYEDDEYYDVHFGESGSNMKKKTISGYVALKEIFPSLRQLLIDGFRKLKNISSGATLNFKSLRHLEIRVVGGCEPHLDIIKKINCDILTFLHLYNITELRSLPEELSNYSKLERLQLENCKNLVCLPTSLKSLTSLEEVKIMYCQSLTYLRDDMFEGLDALRKLEIFGCHNIDKIPSSLAECISLEVVDIAFCGSLKGPIPDLRKSKGLIKLRILIKECYNSMIEWIPHLPHLRQLTTNCVLNEEKEDDHEIKQDLENPLTNKSLDYLNLEFKKGKMLPQQLLQLHLPNLCTLQLNCEELEELPSYWIGTLSSLRELFLYYCRKLKFLPSKEHLLGLQCLKIDECPILKERILAKDDDAPDLHNKQFNKIEIAQRLCHCLPFLSESSTLPSESKSEWHKISHVPDILVKHGWDLISARELRKGEQIGFNINATY